MKTNTREDDSLPYKEWIDPKGQKHFSEKKRKSFLSPQEAFRAAQLEQLVESYDSLVREYLLIRASLSSNRLERKAWYILYLLLRFVEGYGRFPSLRRTTGKSELTDFLEGHLLVDSNQQQKLVNEFAEDFREKEILLKIEIPPPRPLDISRVREVGDQLRLQLRRTLNTIQGSSELRRKELKGEEYEI